METFRIDDVGLMSTQQLMGLSKAVINERELRARQQWAIMVKAFENYCELATKKPYTRRMGVDCYTDKIIMEEDIPGLIILNK